MSLVLPSLLPFPNSCQGMNPHQQGRGTKMIQQGYGGIDVSKDRLDVMVLPERHFFWVENSTAGGGELVQRLRGWSVATVGLEPSGGYERGVIRALLAAGLLVRRVNPHKTRQVSPGPRGTG